MPFAAFYPSALLLTGHLTFDIWQSSSSKEEFGILVLWNTHFIIQNQFPSCWLNASRNTLCLLCLTAAYPQHPGLSVLYWITPPHRMVPWPAPSPVLFQILLQLWVQSYWQFVSAYEKKHKKLKVEIHRSTVSTDGLHTKSITEQQSYLFFSTVSKYDLVTKNLANEKIQHHKKTFTVN